MIKEILWSLSKQRWKRLSPVWSLSDDFTPCLKARLLSCWSLQPCRAQSLHGWSLLHFAFFLCSDRELQRFVIDSILGINSKSSDKQLKVIFLVSCNKEQLGKKDSFLLQLPLKAKKSFPDWKSWVRMCVSSVRAPQKVSSGNPFFFFFLI